MTFFVLILRQRLQSYSTNAKRYPQKKVFGDSEFCSSCQKPQFSRLLGLLWFWREEQNSEFPKFFFGGYLFVFVEYLCNRSPKIKTKNVKNYNSILVTVNHRNWLDDSPPLTKNFFCVILFRFKKKYSYLAAYGDKPIWIKHGMTEVSFDCMDFAFFSFAFNKQSHIFPLVNTLDW